MICLRLRLIYLGYLLRHDVCRYAGVDYRIALCYAMFSAEESHYAGRDRIYHAVWLLIFGVVPGWTGSHHRRARRFCCPAAAEMTSI